MAEDTVITEEYRQALGVEGEPAIIEIEKGQLLRFSRAIGDPNPIWQDEEWARKSRFGGIIAMPLAFLDAANFPYADKLINIKAPVWRVLKGGIEVEYYKPMKVGDVITARTKLHSIDEKQGKTGKFLTMQIEISFTNQHGEPVLKCWHSFVKR